MLSGWQRLWVFISFLLLIAHVAILIDEIPTSSELERKWADASIEQTLELEEFERLSLWQVRDKYSDFTDTELTDHIQARFTDQSKGYNLNFNVINARHTKRVDNLFSEQVKLIGMYFGVWFSIIVTLYLFGWGISWIRLGFKNS